MAPTDVRATAEIEIAWQPEARLVTSRLSGAGWRRGRHADNGSAREDGPSGTLSPNPECIRAAGLNPSCVLAPRPGVTFLREELFCAAIHTHLDPNRIVLPGSRPTDLRSPLRARRHSHICRAGSNGGSRWHINARHRVRTLPRTGRATGKATGDLPRRTESATDDAFLLH